MVLLGSSFSASGKTIAGDVSGVIVKLSLLQNSVGVDDDLTDIPLRSCWEGIRIANQALTELSSVTRPLVKSKSNKNKLSAELVLCQTLLDNVRRQHQQI